MSGPRRLRSYAPSAPVTLRPWKANSLLGWSFDPLECTGSTSPTAATIYLSKIMVPDSTTVTNLQTAALQAGTSYTNGQLGLYSSAGTFLGATAVQSSAGTNGFGSAAAISIALASAVAIAGGPDVFVWGAIHLGTNNATTVQFVRTSATFREMGIGLTAATARFGSYAGHATNDLATIGNLTPASISASVSSPFLIGLS